MGRFWRRRRDLEIIAEADAYRRCHGERSGDIVSVAPRPPEPPRRRPLPTGEQLRQALEARLDARRP